MSENLFNIPLSLEEEYEHYHVPKVHKKALILNDIHVPFHSYACVDTVFNWAQGRGHDLIILNGDIMDCHTVSHWERDPRLRNLKEELDIGRAFLDSVEMAFPNAKKIYKEGNHEERLERYLKQKAAELLGTEEFMLENLLKTRARGIEYIKDQRAIYLGQLPVIHGHEANIKSTSVNVARTLYLRLKHSGMCGHLHKVSQHTETRRLDGEIISTWSIGHMSDPHPQYTRNNEWAFGFCEVEFDQQFFDVSNYKIIDNKIYRS